ncbi:hypothetical protein PV04_10498 [Phialophora macrospora]|uniref:Clr5 domain-containing protein n=1 Tax=Phialophora macrospora TaxID=1851006 RepID=A0A0D2F5P5_9EURO|nr:hypothetical protein PV04_10498 [Phialophora macrospora]
MQMRPAGSRGSWCTANKTTLQVLVRVVGWTTAPPHRLRRRPCATPTPETRSRLDARPLSLCNLSHLKSLAILWVGIQPHRWSCRSLQSRLGLVSIHGPDLSLAQSCYNQLFLLPLLGYKTSLLNPSKHCLGAKEIDILTMAPEVSLWPQVEALPEYSIAFAADEDRRASKSLPRSRVTAKQYSAAEWKTMRGIITQLYCKEKLTVAELIRHLHSEGFGVNERMLHTRIKKWKIGRNHKFKEMRTAAELLADHQDRQGPSVCQSAHAAVDITGKKPFMPSFNIRGDSVSYKEFLRYFRRKKINDPIAWVKEHKDDKFTLSDDVRLVTAADLASKDSSSCDEDPVDVFGPLHMATIPQQHHEQPRYTDFDNLADVSQWSLVDCCNSDEGSQQLPDRSSSADPWSLATSSLVPDSKSLSPVSMPIFIRSHASSLSEHLDYSIMGYMSSFLTTSSLETQPEPLIHAHTTHAIFASKMQDGISTLANLSLTESCRKAASRSKKRDPAAMRAFTSFRNGFYLLEEILIRHNPMSLALVLGVICELASHTASPTLRAMGVPVLLNQLLSYIHEMSGTLHGPEYPLTTFFGLLLQEYQHPTASTTPGSPPLADCILKSLDMAITQLQLSSSHLHGSKGGPSDWRALYLRERLCDALYHSGSSFQLPRASMRKLLLRDQEAKSGPTARNVLWTLTNVADDCLASGDVDAAIEHFDETLRRATTLEDVYGREKTSFAALEGLGRCYVAKAESVPVEDRVPRWQAPDQAYVLQDALQSVSGQQSPTCCSCQCHGHSSSATSTSTSSRSTADSTKTSTPTTLPSRSARLYPPAESPRTQHLKSALHYFSSAESRARMYFEASSRRIARVSLRRQEVVEILGRTTPPSSDSESGAGSSGASDDEFHDMAPGMTEQIGVGDGLSAGDVPYGFMLNLGDYRGGTPDMGEQRA